VHTPPAATDAITDVIAGTAAGHTAYAMLPIPPAAAYLRDGRLVALGVSTARRSRLLPDGLRADQDAVTNGLTLRWSSGSVEGHVNLRPGPHHKPRQW
jgi:hypothetical protein